MTLLARLLGSFFCLGAVILAALLLMPGSQKPVQANGILQARLSSAMDSDAHYTTDGLSLLGITDGSTEFKKAYQPVIEHLPRIMALTFDDGPHRKRTPELLSILAKHGVPATFFVLGEEVEKNPDVAKQIVADGHQIGNHTWNHRFSYKMSMTAIREQIDGTAEKIWEITGVWPTVFRPPYGAQIWQLNHHKKYPLIFWSIDSEDWRRRNQPGITKHVVDNFHPGAVILMHDIYQTSIDSVEPIILAAKQEGYTFVTIDELFGWDQHPEWAQVGEVYRYQTFETVSVENQSN